MTTPNRPLGLGFALITTLFAAACDEGTEDHDAARLAVVLVSADGQEHGVGSYDVESGDLDFAPAVQDEMREVIGGHGYRAVVTHGGEDADVDLDDGLATTTPDLEDGDVLELRAARADGATPRRLFSARRSNRSGRRGTSPAWTTGRSRCERPSVVLHHRRCRPTTEAFRAKLPSVLDIADSTRRLPLTTALVLGACFNEAGDNTGGEGTSNGDTTASSSGPASTSAASADTSSSDTGSADTMVATTDTGTTDASSGDASTSTGEPVDPCIALLACDGGELLCESFEPPFALDRSPWGASGGPMAEPPSVTDQVAACGAQSISTAVDPDDEWYSQFGVTFPMGDLTSAPMRLRAKYWLEASCFAVPAVRVLTLQFPAAGGGIWYQFEATISPLELQLLSSDQSVNRVSRSAAIDFQPATWAELVLDFDMTTNPPTAVLALDGVAIGDDPIPGVDGALDQPTSAVFGVYAFDQPFPDGCVAYVDDVVVEAL